MNYKDILEEKYNKYDENSRLIKDKSHYVEYYIVSYFIRKYLKLGDKIADIGAGTGAYSIGLANLGFDVCSVDLVSENVKKLESKITKDMKIKVFQGDAQDLSFLSESDFNLTLCLGPLYHLFKIDEIKTTLLECSRITKNDGYIFFSFKPSDALIYNWLMKKNCFEKRSFFMDNNYNPKNLPKENFSFWRIEDIINMIHEIKSLQIVEMFSVNGLTMLFDNYVNSMSGEVFQDYLNYVKSSCTKPELLGGSSQIVVICKIDKEKFCDSKFF